MTWTADLQQTASQLGVAERLPSLVGYIEVFERWNRRINLSAARTAADIADHVIDCLALVAHVPPSSRVVDIGSGGGLPGLVLAAARPDLSLTCVEPIHKKAAFLRQAARDLSLTVSVLTIRLEEVEPGFDVAVSRATFDLATWLQHGARLVRPGGLVLGMEGLDHVDLPPGATRHPYTFRNRTRAIITFRPTGI